MGLQLNLEKEQKQLIKEKKRNFRINCMFRNKHTKIGAFHIQFELS